MNEYTVVITHEVDGEMVETVGTVVMSHYPEKGEAVTVTLRDENGVPINRTGSVVFVF